MSIIKKIKSDLLKIVKKAGYDIGNISFESSNRKDLGDYQLNDALQLASKYHENPRVIAEKIVKELEKDSRFININIAGAGFINFSFSDKFLYDSLNKIYDNPLIDIDKCEKKKVIIDYGGANVAKALHVGHLRSANIGEALKRLAKLLGYEVIGDAHLGDYGRPLGLVIREIKEMYPNLTYFDPSYDKEYTEVLPITNKDLEIIYPRASAKAKEDEQYLEEAREITFKLQNHERGYYDLWKKIVEISTQDIKKVYEDLNVDFELWNGESDGMEYFSELLKMCEDKNVLIESEGAKIIDVSKEDDKNDIPPLLFIKSNQTVSYATTDLATILERVKNYDPEEIWYVVDKRQALHFTQVFRATKKIGIVDDNTNLEHVDFGTINGKDGKPFKTRDGGVMTLKNLISLVYNETFKRINTEMSIEEKEKTAHSLAIAALKYADFLPYRSTDYIFDIDKFTDLEGKTGPYLLYSTIRMKSLLNKAGDENSKITKLRKTEKEIALQILELSNTLEKSLKSKSLNEIAEYLYNLTSLYNTFYAENKIITEKDQDLKNSWIVLTKIVYHINTLLLDTLGIKVPDKM